MMSRSETQENAGMFVGELLQELGASEEAPLTLKHPFGCGTLTDRRTILRLLADLQAPVDSVTETLSIADENIAARSWRVEFSGRPIAGVSALLRTEKGFEIRITLSSLPAIEPWQKAVESASRALVPPNFWQLPEGTDTSLPSYDPSEKLDPKFPFEIADDIVFESPVLTKAIRGAEQVSRVVAHASAVYGERDYGPRLQSGPTILSFWTGHVSGVPIEVSNVIKVNHKRQVHSMTMSMQPWPAVRLFRDRCRARTEHFLDRTYFELESAEPPGHASANV